MNDIDLVVSRLQSLREQGVRVAIDDFGTGYSSLSYLQELPLDVLKIDRSFVNRLTGRMTKSSLIETIQTLASGLDLETVAEGVEHSEQLALIAGLGCDLVQGYFYSRPVSATDIPETIQAIQSQNLLLNPRSNAA
jgi:EAL domain-containing protein (putative c-di-GMP-specific phosphodiesterase class I)